MRLLIDLGALTNERRECYALPSNCAAVIGFEKGLFLLRNKGAWPLQLFA
jgi:hypothetical protein